MKKLIFISFMACCSIFSSATEDVFPLSDAEWIEEEHYTLEVGISRFYKVYLEGDTVIEGIKESKLYMYILDTPEDIWFVGTIRIEDKKVYFRLHSLGGGMGLYDPCNDDQEVFLLYDFGLEKGDMVPWCGFRDSEGFEITDVDTYPLGGAQRKRYVFNDNYTTDYCIEGMGNTGGVLSPVSLIPINGMKRKVVYFKQNGETLYYDPPANPMPVEDAALNVVMEIYPNPANGRVYLASSGEMTNVAVYTSDGLLMKNVKTGGEFNTDFGVSELQPGNYLIKITFKNGSHINRKLLIN